MSLRWRLTGELICGAKSKPMEGDSYIGDRLHYELSVIQRVLVPHHDEETTGLWSWLHKRGDDLTLITTKEIKS